MPKWPALALCLIIVGCSPHVRRSPASAAYQFVVVETRHEDVAASMTNAVAPSLKAVNSQAVKDQGIAGKTLVFTMRGDRGFWNCSARGEFLDLISRKPLVQMHTRNGALYMGQDGATAELLQIASEEARRLSGGSP